MGALALVGLRFIGPIFLRLLPYIGIVVAVMYVMHLHSAAAISGMKLKQAEIVAEDNRQAVEQLQKDKAKQDEVVASMARDAEARSRTFLAVRKDILSAKDSKNCSSSPAIRALLTGLRQQGAPTGPQGGGPRQDARGAAALQGAAPGSKH